MYPHRKLLIVGINELLSRDLITLETKESDIEKQNDKGHIFVEIAGHPSVILWEDIGFDEFRVSVWWKYNHDKHPQANLAGNARENFRTSEPLAKRSQYRNFVGVTVSGWLERRTGKYLMGKGRRGLTGLYTRKDDKLELEKLPIPKPNGYLPEGKFIM